MINIYELITDMSDVNTYSFSKLNFDCMYCYYLNYVAPYEEKLKKVGNGLAQVGSFCHKLLEDYGKGELLQFELKDKFLSGFDNAVPYGVKLVFDSGFSKDLTENYKIDCANFFENYDGIDFGEQISAEESFKFLIKIKDKLIVFRGVIDCVVKDDDGEYHLVDFKSKSAFKSKDELQHYARQLYMYSIYIKNKYGKYPKTLRFLQFRINHTETIEFTEDGLDETLEWAYKQMEIIENEQMWVPKCLEESEKQKQKLKSDFFFGNNLCNFRFSCPYSPLLKKDDE